MVSSPINKILKFKVWKLTGYSQVFNVSLGTHLTHLLLFAHLAERYGFMKLTIVQIFQNGIK
jgi:hypothetical protein